MFDKNLMKLDGMAALLAAQVAFSLLQAVCITGQSVALALCVSLLWDGAAIAEALPSLAFFAACFALLQVLRFIQETTLDAYSVRQAASLRSKLFGRAFDERDPEGLPVAGSHVATMANDGIDEVEAYLRIVPPKTVALIAVTAVLLVGEFLIDWVSGIIVAAMLPVSAYFMILIGKQARDRSERQYASYTRLTNRFMDTLRGLPVIRAFGAVDVEGGAVFDKSEELRRATMRTMRAATLSSALLDLCATFGVAAVAIMLAFRLMDGSIVLFTGLSALIIAAECFAPIRSYASDYHASLDGKNSLADILGFLGEGLHPLEDGTDDGDVSGEISSIELRGVSYQYRSGAFGVRDVDLRIREGEKVCIVGKSGSGKSTLANIVAGFANPTQGEVLVGGAGGSADPWIWRRHVRYIPQNPHLFTASLASNIAFYRSDAKREEVEAAARAVGLGPLIESLDDGLDTLVGEGGRGLSGGEAHRVALARVLLDPEADVLVFDEPTAHLDVETERDLKPVMLAAMEGKLVLFATHRLHWMEDMDRVVVLDGGSAIRKEAAHA